MSGRFQAALANNATPPPRPVLIAQRATQVWAALTVLAAIVLYGNRGFVRDTLIKNNNKLGRDGKKSFKENYTLAQAHHDAGNVLLGGLITALIGAAILLLLAMMLVRARAMTRWILVGMATIIPIIFQFNTGIFIQLLGGITLSDGPILYRLVMILAGLASLLVLVMLLMPETGRWMAANRPAPVAGRPSLFGRRPPRAAGPGGGSTASSSKSAPDGGAGVIDVAPSPSGASGGKSGAARAAKSRGTATRPGSVKPKGARAGTKSRNQ
jgi:hypothetical protein